MKRITTTLFPVLCLLSFQLLAAEKPKVLTPRDVMTEARKLRSADFVNFLPSGEPAYYQHENIDKSFMRYRDVLSMTNATPSDKVEALRRMAECRLDADFDEKEAEKLYEQAIALPGLPPADAAKAVFNRADYWRKKGDYAGALREYERFLAMTNASLEVRQAALNGCLETRADRDGWTKAFAWADRAAPAEVRSYSRLAWYASRAEQWKEVRRYVDLAIAHEITRMPNGRYRFYPYGAVTESLSANLNRSFEEFAEECEHYVTATAEYYPSQLDKMLPPLLLDRGNRVSRSPMGRDPRFLPFMEKMFARCPDQTKVPGPEKFLAFAFRTGDEASLKRVAMKALEGKCPPALQAEAEAALALVRAGTDGLKAADGFRDVFVRCSVTNDAERAALLKTAIRTAMTFRPRRFEVASELFRLRETMYARPEPKRTMCPFVTDTLSGAAAILASDVWKNAKKEIFDRPYGDSLQTLIDSDVSVATRAKTVYRGEKFRPTEMAAFCDVSGVKILMRSYTDPAKMRRIADGYEILTTFEAFLAFDEEGPYHQFFTSWRGNGVDDTFVTQYDNGTGWRRPSTRSGRLTCERLVLKDGIATLFTVSWENVFASLPDDGDHWRFECFDWQYGGWSWSGTKDVHGRSQMGAVVFTGLDAAAKTAIRRRLLSRVKAAVAGSRNADRAGELDFWKDPYVGDREFYRAKLADLEQKLVAETNRIAADMSDREVNEVWDAVGVTALNLKYVIAKLRTEWLEEKHTEAGSLP